MFFFMYGIRKAQEHYRYVELHLYMRVCPSVGPSVRPSVSPSVGWSVRDAFVKNGKIDDFDRK